MATLLLNKTITLNPSKEGLTKSVKLRMVNNQDALLISNYYQRNRAHLQPWEPTRDESFHSVASWHKKLAQLVELQLRNMSFCCLILDQQETNVLGVITFSQVSRFPMHACYVGYSLCHLAQGQGIMRRALKEACHYMFTVQNLHRVMAGYMPRNQRSESVLKSVGFEQEGYAKEYLLINGKWEDHILMSLPNLNWTEPSE